MKYRIYAGAVLLAVLAAAVFGFSKRQTFTDLRREADFPDQLSVAQLSLSLTQMDCERMAQELPQAPYIFRVRVLEDVEFLFGASRQKVQVEEVYAGETVLPGDVLYLTGHCSLCLYAEPRSLECSFINLPVPGRQYLVFCQNTVEALDSSIPVYQLYQGSLIAPVFWDGSADHAIFPTDGENAYVPYSAVRSNEFFPADESALETWNALKADLLLRYPAAG